MSVTLILTILGIVAQDGPSIYGGIMAAIDAIKRLVDQHGDGVTLGHIDSVLREHNVDVQEIQATYAPGNRPEGNGSFA